MQAKFPIKNILDVVIVCLSSEVSQFLGGYPGM